MPKMRETNFDPFVFRLRYEYELLVVPGLVLNDSIKPIVQKIAKEPPIMINPDQLGGSEAAGKTFTMGIRLKTVNNVIAFECRTIYEIFPIFTC